MNSKIFNINIIIKIKYVIKKFISNFIKLAAKKPDFEDRMRNVLEEAKAVRNKLYLITTLANKQKTRRCS